MLKPYTIPLLCTASLLASSLHAEPLTITHYLTAVEQHSPQLQSAQQEVISAQAEIGIARLRPDPELMFSSERERIRSGEPRPSTRGLELSWELETGGKRGARIRSAQSGVQLAKAGQYDTRQQLLAEAAEAFIQSCHDQLALERKQDTLAAFERIEQANALRHQAGDIGGVEWLQSRLERDRFAAEVRQAKAEARASYLALMVPLGRALDEVFGNTDIPLQCDFLQTAATIEIAPLPQLIARSHEQRSDLLAAQAALEYAQSQVNVTRSERWVNPTLAIGTERTRATPEGINFSGDAFDPAPASRTLMLSLSVPLPLSKLNRGEMIQAESAVTQAMLELQHTRIALEADVRSAWALYQSALDTAQQYQSGMLEDARRVLDGMQFSYQNGAASLLELMSAQHDMDETVLEALTAQTELARAIIQLQLSSGQRPWL